MSPMRIAILPVLLVGIALAGCSQDECEPSESRCEGATAVNCIHTSNKITSGYVWERTECGGSNVCVKGADFAGCAAEDKPCDPATFEPTCKDGRPVACKPPTDYTKRTYPVVQEACNYANTCFKGRCVADTTPCDASFKPTCVNGTPVECIRELTQSSTGYPVYMANACAATGNTCVEGATYAGCSSDGSTCVYETFRVSCDGLRPKVCDLAEASTESVWLTRYAGSCNPGQTCTIAHNNWSCQ